MHNKGGVWDETMFSSPNKTDFKDFQILHEQSQNSNSKKNTCSKGLSYFEIMICKPTIDSGANFRRFLYHPHRFETYQIGL